MRFLIENNTSEVSIDFIKCNAFSKTYIRKHVLNTKTVRLTLEQWGIGALTLCEVKNLSSALQWVLYIHNSVTADCSF